MPRTSALLPERACYAFSSRRSSGSIFDLVIRGLPRITKFGGYVNHKKMFSGKGLTRRKFLGGATALAVGGSLGIEKLFPQAPPAAANTLDVALTNGRIHTMDATNRVVSQVLIRNGRFAAVGNTVPTQGVRVVNLMGKTVIPGIID